MQPSWVLGAATMAVGGLITRSALRDARLARGSVNWKTTQGTVLRVRGHAGSTHRGDEFASPEYEYTVDGVTHRSRVYDYAGRNTVTIAGRRPQLPRSGERVTVYYDPDDPKRAVLSTGGSSFNALAILLGILLLAVGLVVFLSAL